MKAEQWRLPALLGHHLVTPQKAGIGRYRVTVPGVGDVEVPAECLERVLPEEPPEGTVVRAPCYPKGERWQIYVRLSYGWHLGASLGSSAKSWSELFFQYGEVEILYKPGAPVAFQSDHFTVRTGTEKVIADFGACCSVELNREEARELGAQLLGWGLGS